MRELKEAYENVDKYGGLSEDSMDIFEFLKHHDLSDMKKSD